MEITLDKLQKARNLNNRNEVSPKVETTSFAANTNSNVHPSINDKIPEI